MNSTDKSINESIYTTENYRKYYVYVKKNPPRWLLRVPQFLNEQNIFIYIIIVFYYMKSIVY